MPSRRAVNWAKFRVLVVGICALSILAVLAYLLTGGTLLQAKTTLFLYIPDATGVTQGSPVRVNGIQVGKVRSVKLTQSTDPNRVVQVVLTVEVEHLRNIPADSYAQISADTLIGDKFVDISSGRLANYIAPNSELRYQPPTDIMKSLDLAQFQRQLRVVDAMLRDIESGKNRVGELVMGDEMYEDLRVKLAELQRGLTAAAATTGQVGGVLYTEELYLRIATPVRRLDEALARVQSGQGAAGQMLRDTGEYDRLRDTFGGLHKTLEDMRRGQGTGADLIAGDSAWNDLTAKVASMIEAVDRLNAGPLLTRSDWYESLDGAAREARESVRDFRKDPSRYLRLNVF